MPLLLSLLAAGAYTVGGLFMRKAEGFAHAVPAAMVFGCFCAGAALQTLAMRRSELSVNYILVLGLEAAFALVLGVAWLGEGLSARKLAGAALVLAGIVSLRLGERPNAGAAGGGAAPGAPSASTAAPDPAALDAAAPSPSRSAVVDARTPTTPRARRTAAVERDENRLSSAKEGAMTRKATLALAAAAAVVFPQGLAAKSPTVPERLLVVRYVALGIDVGDRIVAAEELIGDAWRATPREREALEEIRQRLEGWDRYVVVNRLAEAELLLVVRQGRRGSIGGSVWIGAGSGGGVPPVDGGGARRAYGGAFSSRDDMLAVYDTGGSPSTPLWRMLASDGLSGKIPLFEAFRADVERAATGRKRP